MEREVIKSTEFIKRLDNESLRKLGHVSLSRLEIKVSDDNGETPLSGIIGDAGSVVDELFRRSSFIYEPDPNTLSGLIEKRSMLGRMYGLIESEIARLTDKIGDGEDE